MDLTTPEWTHLFVHQIFDFLSGFELLNQTCLVCSAFNNLVKMYISKQTMLAWKMEKKARKFSLKNIDQWMHWLITMSYDHEQPSIHSLQEYETLSCIGYMSQLVFDSSFFISLSFKLNEDDRRQVARFMKQTIQTGPLLLLQDHSTTRNDIQSGGYSLYIQYENEEYVSYLLSEFPNRTKIHTLHMETTSPMHYYDFHSIEKFYKYQDIILSQLFMYRSLILHGKNNVDLWRVCQSINPHIQQATIILNSSCDRTKIPSLCNKFESNHVHTLWRFENNEFYNTAVNIAPLLTGLKNLEAKHTTLEFTGSKGFTVELDRNSKSESSSSNNIIMDEISMVSKISINGSRSIDIIPTGLKELHLEVITFTDGYEFIQLLRKNCHSLEYLHLCSVNVPYRPNVLNEKPFSFPKLKHLIIDGCTIDVVEKSTPASGDNDDDGHKKVVPWLRIFDFHHSCQLQTVTFKRNSPELTHLPFSRINSLKQLTWEQLENIEDFKQLSECSYLTDLQLIYNRTFDQIALFQLGDKLQYLSQLIISGKIISPILVAREIPNGLTPGSMRNSVRFIHLDKQELFSKTDDERDYQFVLSKNHDSVKMNKEGQQKVSQLHIISILNEFGSLLQNNTQLCTNVSPFSEYFKSIFCHGLFPCIIYSRILSSGLKASKNFIVSNFDLVIEVLVPFMHQGTSSETTFEPIPQNFRKESLLGGGRDLSISNNHGLVMVVLLVDKAQIVHATCELNPKNLTPQRLKEIEQDWIKIYR